MSRRGTDGARGVPRGSGEDGASLILILILLAFTALVVGAVVKLARIGLDASIVTNEKAKVVFDVNGGLQAYINQVRNSTYDDNISQLCPPLSFPGPNTGSTITVNCQSETGTGRWGKVAWGASNRPPNAITALGAAEAQGVDQTSSSELKVYGDLKSNSPIRASPGSLAVTGNIAVQGGCTGTITATGTTNCAATTPATDPGYAQPSAGMTYRTVPACGAGSVVTFQPGYYDDAQALSRLMNTDCPDKLFWFQGAAGGATYYFDFHNGETPATDPDFGDTQAKWLITNAAVRVVAGGTAAPSVPVAIPGACDPPSQLAANNGVQFVFGGRSQLEIQNGQMEICGEYEAAAPPIAIYGAKTGEDKIGLSQPMRAVTAWADAGCTVVFNNPDRIQYLEASDTGANVSTTNNMTSAGQTACVSVPAASSFAPTTAIPVGSVLTNATLIVRHREPTPSYLSLTARITPRTNPAKYIDVPSASLPVSGTFVTRSVDLTSQLFNDGSSLFDEVHANGFTGAGILYTVTRTAGAGTRTASVNSIQMNLTFKAPAIRAQNTGINTFATTGKYTLTIVWATNGTPGTGSGTADPAPDGTPNAAANCVGTAPYTPPGDATHCPFVKTSGSGVLYTQGTAYAPLAAFDITVGGVTKPIFPYGVVARKLAVSSGYTAPANLGDFNGTSIMIPPDSPGTAESAKLAADFHAYTPYCPDTSSPPDLCGGARATYEDPSGRPVSGSRNVFVTNWQLYF